MFTNHMIKQKIQNSEPAIGSWCQIGHPANAEILAEAGFGWIAADCEHGEVDESDIANFCRSVKRCGSVPLVRVRENSLMSIRRALDLGADGIIVPLVNNADDAKSAVDAARYPPAGRRGFAFHNANNWGVLFDEYVEVANNEVIVIAMVESKEAVENIDAILSVDGIDGVFIGPYDMSGSFGIPGETSNEIVKEACHKVARACTDHNKAAGQHIVLPTKENVKMAIKDGFTFLALGMDTVFLSDGAMKAMEMF